MQRWFVNAHADLNQSTVQAAGDFLKQGKLVAFPTETVYGLGADAWNEDAVSRVFKAKGRPADNPLIVHIADKEQLDSLLPSDYQVTDIEQRLIDAFWPGPLTLIFPAGRDVAASVHPNSDTIAVRMPSHPVAQAVIRASGCPIAAPSANTSSKPSPTTADAVIQDLGDVIDGLVDGGETTIGVESTVLLVESERAIILRPGGVTQEMIAEIIDIPVVYDAHLVDLDAHPISPGMKYRHYAPNARVHVWWGDAEEIYTAMLELLAGDEEDQVNEPIRPAIIAPADFVSRFEFPVHKDVIASLDAPDYEVQLAHQLYKLLRHFDAHGVSDILVHGVNPAHGMGTAVMNRLQRAAEGRIFRV